MDSRYSHWICSRKPRQIKFQILFPQSTVLEGPFHRRQLRIFASVEQTLSTDGLINMRALAIY